MVSLIKNLVMVYGARYTNSGLGKMNFLKKVTSVHGFTPICPDFIEINFQEIYVCLLSNSFSAYI